MKKANSLGLMKQLVVESFKQNSNSEAAKKLMQYENFTHNGLENENEIDAAFIEGLELAQAELESIYRSKDKKKTKKLKIISGGQTGVDLLGLEVAKLLGLETGGTAPPGFQTSDGSNLELRDIYNLKEISEELQKGQTGRKFYNPRTEQNVKNSDGTILFGNTKSVGSKLTIKIAESLGKPLIENPSIEQVKQFLKGKSVINIAGNRKSGLSDKRLQQIRNILIEGLRPTDAAYQEEKAERKIIEKYITQYSQPASEVSKQMKGFDIKYIDNTYAFVYSVQPVYGKDLTPSYFYIYDIREGEYQIYHKASGYMVPFEEGFKSQKAVKEAFDEYINSETAKNLEEGYFEDNDSHVRRMYTALAEEAMALSMMAAAQEQFVSFSDKFDGFKEKLEELARRTLPVKDGVQTQPIETLEDFEGLLAELGVTIEEFENFLEFRLEQEFQNFDTLMSNEGIYEMKDIFLGGSTNDTVNQVLNLVEDQASHNMKQIFLNDYINTSSLMGIYLGDIALSLKDAVDEIKRARGMNGSIISAESVVADPNLNIMFPVREFDLLTMTDSYFKSLTSGKNGEATDGQLYMTLKAFKYFWFGIGQLTKSQEILIQKIDKGLKIRPEEVFGALDETGRYETGYVKKSEMINAKKLLYFDGQTFLKMSAFVLTKELTSEKKPQKGWGVPFKWVPKTSMVLLHNLREKLEVHESKNPKTLGVATFMSASKMMKERVQDLNKMVSENKITDKFLDQISLLTLEDIITIKLELSLKNSGGLLYGLPIWNNLSDIIRYSLLKSSLSLCKNKTEAANFLGITLGRLFELIEKYNLTESDD